MPTDLNAFLTAITGKNWFALAALIMMALLQLSKNVTLTAPIWAKVPVGWRWVLPVLGAAAAAFVHGYFAKETFGDSVWDGFKIAVTAIGVHAGLTESVLPYNGGAGGAPSIPLPAPAPVAVASNVTPIGDRPTPPDPQPPAAA